MPARRRRPTGRDRRRRSLGQNFLTDPDAIERLVASFEPLDDVLVVEPGPGRGALTLPLARAGARIIAVEADRRWADRLRRDLATAKLSDRVEVRVGDLRTARLPPPPYRVIANPPFGATTDLLDRLLDDPAAGPDRADLLLQREVARKRAVAPPSTLRSAAWAPWWSFELGPAVGRRSFRPIPTVDAAVLVIRRRVPPILPVDLAPSLREALREPWAHRSPG